MRLLPGHGVDLQGEIMFEGRNIARLSGPRLREMRGREIAMVFQDPMSTLNPVFPVGEQVAEALKIHGLYKGREKEEVFRLLREVGIPHPEKRYREYPHQFSGGMQQRILLAIALACAPKLILADEPTTALDVTIQAQILELFKEINLRHHTAIVLVTHNLAVAAEFCEDIAVMYAGQIVEAGPAEVILKEPRHPYTKGLLKAIPKRESKKESRLATIPGSIPDMVEIPPGCSFHPRCPEAKEDCAFSAPPVVELGGRAFLRCHLFKGVTR
jgi:peptide/nickel transport system ATP-binding protein/oligopeptide transport system ATP-binding protein